MPDISKITLPSGSTYDIKDSVARAQIGGAIIFRGTTTTALTDDDTTNPITINGESYTAQANDAVFYGTGEFVFDGTHWHKFGDMTGLGDLATKDTASASYQPAGSVSAPTIELNTTNVNSIENVGTLPTFTVSNEVLTISPGTLPTKGETTSVATSIRSVSTPTFTGTSTTITVS